LRPFSPGGFAGAHRPEATSTVHPRTAIRGAHTTPHSPLIKVQVRPNESLESALRRFKRQCNYSGIFRLFKARTWHEKRSDKRRRERRERLRTVLKAARRNDPNFRGRNARPNRSRRARRARPQMASSSSESRSSESSE
jgi:small subunit ribosomal protein S21